MAVAPTLLKSGKILLAAILAGATAAVILTGLSHGFAAVLANLWKIPLISEHFGDLSNVTGAAESLRAGHDPLYENPGDPWDRPLNQPRIVQHIAMWFGVRYAYTFPLGVLLIVLFALGIFIALPAFDRLTAVWIAALALSPAVMLGIERANTDLLIFFIVALSLASKRIWLWAGLLMLAAFLKLFPVFAVTRFLKYDRRTFWIASVVFLGVFIAYLGFNAGDLKQVFATTQKGYGLYAYGTLALSPYSKLMISWVPAIIVLLTIALFRFGNPSPPTREKEAFADGRFLDAFRVGTGIYCGTFLLGNSWTYRLMFLILVIPQLVRWREIRGRRLVSLITLGAIAVAGWSLWLAALPEFAHYGAGVCDYFAKWVVFAALVYLLLDSLPSWVHAGLARRPAPRG